MPDEQPTEEQLLIINCALYDDKFSEVWNELHENPELPPTLLDWANYREEHLEPFEGRTGPAATMYEDWQKLFDTIQANPDVYNAMTIVDARERSSGGSMATIFYNNTVIIGFEGNHGNPEWTDNALGGHPDITDTPVQQEAMNYYRAMTETYLTLPGTPAAWSKQKGPR